MILKGNQRSGARDLALHLMKDENEHIEIHEIRGFISNDLYGAFMEAHAITKGTKCKQFLFSLSLNPPQYEQVGVEAFERVADAAEKRLGLTGQPRAIVFHEKEGRRHAHVVWSRINAQTMTAINLPHYKRKLTALSKELYLEHGWELPKGLRDPLLRNPREIKQAFRDAWHNSDSVKALKAALNEHGFMLARGDRRGYVAIDYVGEVYSLPRWAGIKTKEAKERLGDPKYLPSVDEAKQIFRDKIKPQFDDLKTNMEREHKARLKPLFKQKRQLARDHAIERDNLRERQAHRWIYETGQRQSHLRKGIKGMWDWLSGKAEKIKRQNQYEAWDAQKRDRYQMMWLTYSQIKERQRLQQDIVETRDRYKQESMVFSQVTSEGLRVEGRKMLQLNRVRIKSHRKQRNTRQRYCSGRYIGEPFPLQSNPCSYTAQ